MRYRNCCRKTSVWLLMNGLLLVLFDCQGREPDAVMSKSAVEAFTGFELEAWLPKQARLAIPVAKQSTDNVAHPGEEQAQALHFPAPEAAGPYASFAQHLITPSRPGSIQAAALPVPGAMSHQTGTGYVLREWPSLTPELRDEVLNTFLVRPFNFLIPIK